MFNKIYLYFIIPIAFAILVSRSSGGLGLEYQAYPIKQCSDNTSIHGYCLDCDNEMDCDGGSDGASHVCVQNQACRISSNNIYAACSDIVNVPDCSCPEDQSIIKPDPYDETKYLVCSDGYRYIFQCPENEIFDPETEECIIPPTTTTTTTTASGCKDGESEKISVNCTCYRFCLGDGNHIDECCDLGEIYLEDQQKCEFYTPFTCSDKEDGYHFDPHNCSVYYLCVDKELFATYNCPEGETYDEETKACAQGATCNAVEDCGVCPDDKTFIYIDCNNFYDCEKNEESDTPEFVPVLDTCPEGTCFNVDSTNCE